MATGGSMNSVESTARVKLSCGLVALAVCSFTYLLSAVHAYLARTLIPWGRLAAPLPFLLLGVGCVLALFYLVYPRAYWPIGKRAIGAGALALLAGSSLIWDAAVQRSRDRRPSDIKAECLAQVSALTKAVNVYANEYGRFPDVRSWHEVARAKATQYGHDILHCSPVPGTRGAYVYNLALSGLMYSALEDPSRTIAVFESDAGWNAAGRPELLPDVPHHFGGDNYGFADGHVQWIKRKRLPEGTWAKAPDADWVIWEPVVETDEAN